MLEGLPLLRILKETPGWPGERKLLDGLLVAKKLARDVGSQICNYRDAARHYEIRQPSDHTCPCRHRYPSKYRPHDGCVNTMDLDIVSHTSLRALMQEGAKFREKVRVDHMQVLKEALATFSAYCIAKFEFDGMSMNMWCADVEARVAPMLPPPLTRTSVLKNASVASALKDIRRHLVVAITDKASKNYSLVCQNYYKKVLHDELHSHGGAYETVGVDEAYITQQYLHQLKLGKCPPKVIDATVDIISADIASPRLPLLYWLPKQHKDPPKARFIAGSSHVMTTPLAKFLTRVLKLVKDELRLRDMVHLRLTGIKRCWFVDSYENIISWLKVLDRPSSSADRCIGTYDFTTMYTTLNQTDTGNNIAVSIGEAFGTPLATDIPQHDYLLHHPKDNTVSWHNPGEPIPDNTTPYTASELARLVRLLINSTYIKNGEHIRKQGKGLPMGTNPAPHMADLTCYAPESRFVDHLTSTTPSLARQFIGTFRFIDDILQVDNPTFSQHVHLTTVPTHQPARPIYPPYLQLQQTSTTPCEAEYLGLIVKDSPRGFYTTIANSKLKFPQPKVTYPSLHGNFPAVLGYGVFTGQLHRFARACTTATDFITQTIAMYHTLLPKGYVAGKLRHYLHNFLIKHSPYKTTPQTIISRFRHAIR
jgi:hypothetical protein